jgi:xanthine/CO dehydrogenase XdhC/CoxF family maturation factor
MPDEPTNDRTAFESAIQSLQSELANVGLHLSVDARARQVYAAQIRLMAEELRHDVAKGGITWAEAAARAQETRNAVMETIRGRSTPVGRAIAQSLKREGKTLNELIARKTVQLFGSGANFSRLSLSAQNRVYAEIVKSAAKSNPQVTAVMRRLSRAGRGLLFLSVALSAYEIATADDKLKTASRELTVTGAGIGGGIAGGAVAGLACGPGAPVCVTIGAFVGGAVAALGVDLFW